MESKFWTISYIRIIGKCLDLQIYTSRGMTRRHRHCLQQVELRIEPASLSYERAKRASSVTYDVHLSHARNNIPRLRTSRVESNIRPRTNGALNSPEYRGWISHYVMQYTSENIFSSIN